MLVAGSASQKYMQKLADQQEIMGAIADMVIEAFAMDSAVLRAPLQTVRKLERSAKGKVSKRPSLISRRRLNSTWKNSRPKLPAALW
jgi:alkylation response protein AidB-like acyl-CoA dehydrogenase